MALASSIVSLTDSQGESQVIRISEGSSKQSDSQWKVGEVYLCEGSERSETSREVAMAGGSRGVWGGEKGAEGGDGGFIVRVGARPRRKWYRADVSVVCARWSWVREHLRMSEAMAEGAT
jgi:hypothetical protein